MSSVLLLSSMALGGVSDRSSAVALAVGGVFLAIIIIFIATVLRAKNNGEYDATARRQAKRQKRLLSLARGASNISNSTPQDVNVVFEMPHIDKPPTDDWNCCICCEDTLTVEHDIECPDSEEKPSQPLIRFPNCDHTFHHSCCHDWFQILSKQHKQFSCPLCRSIVENNAS